MAVRLRSNYATWALATSLVGWSLIGCGTTRTSDTQRTATEQLLISDAIDRAVGALHVNELSGQSVFVDSKYLSNVEDRPYLISSIRQHLMAHGCVLKNEAAKAEIVVEARAGAVGTNRHDLLFGIPSMNLPQIFPLQGIPAAIPEVPIAKRRDQRGVAKVALFAYHRETGLPVWQSGIAQQESTLNDVWLLGAGPFRNGTIHKELAFTRTAIRQRRAASDSFLEGIAREETFVNPTHLASAANESPQERIALAQYAAPASASTAVTPSPEKASHPPASVVPKIAAGEPDLFGKSAAQRERNSNVKAQASTSGWLYSIDERQLLPAKIIGSDPQPFAAPSDLIPLPQPIIDTPLQRTATKSSSP